MAMTENDRLPHRAEHVGSLLRPDTLKKAAQQHRLGAIGDDAFEAVVEQEIANAIRLQEEVGLRSITDGEFRRSSWFGFFFDGLSGLSLKDSRFSFRDADGKTYTWPTCYFDGRLRRTRPICLPEFQTIARHTTAVPKATMPSPSAFHFFRGREAVDPSVYPELGQFWDDLVAVYRQEIADLAAAGCRYLQFDEVPLAMLCDANVRQQISDAGEAPEDFIDMYLDVMGRLLADLPSDMTVGMHMCRGNFRSRWMAEGGYEPVAERLFGELPVDAFFLEYDSPRAGDFSPLRLMGPGKTVVLGIISTKTPELEPIDDLRQRVDAASRYVPLDRLAVSPQCGFASVAGGNSIGAADQKAKLRRVVELADAVWG